MWRLARLMLVMVLTACATDAGPPPSLDPADLQPLGRALYERNCASCHGEDLGGTALGPPLVDARYLAPGFPDAAIATAVTEGVPKGSWGLGPMPALPALSQREIAAVVSHVRAVQQDPGTAG